MLLWIIFSNIILLVEGDHDAVLVLLLVPRLLWKTEVLLNQVKEKFPNVESIDRASLLRGHTVEQYAFRCRLSHLLFNAQVRNNLNNLPSDCQNK